MPRLRETFLDWALTGASVTGVFSALIAHDLLQRVAIRFGSDAHQRAVTSQARWINQAARLTGTRFRVHGMEHADEHKNYLVVMNHQSLFDIAMASDFLGHWQPRYVSKVELGRGIPGVSYNLTRGGSALINRKDPEQAIAAIEELGRRVREDGWTAVIFPEGTRSKTGAMKPFREAGLKTLVRAARGVQVLPITSTGGSAMFRHDLKPVVRNVELGLRLHEPMTPADPDDAAAFSRFVRALQVTIAGGLPAGDRGEFTGRHGGTEDGALSPGLPASL